MVVILLSLLYLSSYWVRENHFVMDIKDIRKELLDSSKYTVKLLSMDGYFNLAPCKLVLMKEI
jgi:hypothetical protein